MRRLLLTLLLPAAACVGGPPPDAAQAQGDIGEIYREVQSYYQDLSARDWKKFADHFWPGAILTTVWTPKGESAPRVVSCTVPEFVAKAPEGPDSKSIFEEKMENGNMRLENNLAQVWSYYTLRFGDEQGVQTTRGVDSITLMRHEGVWKITSIAYAERR